MIGTSKCLLAEPARIPLWPGGAPGALGDADADKPCLTAYLPDSSDANGASVIVCPGGAYSFVAEQHEGQQVAEWFCGMGVAAFVLRYRVAPGYHYPSPLLDARRAVRVVRSKSGEWRLDPGRVGIMGFSAGGHLASMTGTLFADDCTRADDPVDRESSRPGFMILVYPVITMKPPYVNAASLVNLLGEFPDQRLVEELSTDERVTSDTPPAFLMHTNADCAVPPENSVLFYLALRKSAVPAEMHIYAEGQHGFGMGFDAPVLSGWSRRLEAWMRGHKLMDSAEHL